MKSVDVTRVMPSRCATSVATDDLPVPVAPPTSRTSGRSSSTDGLWQERKEGLVETLPDEIVRGEHDAAAVRERVLGDEVDRSTLHLDEVRVGVDVLELALERDAVAEMPRGMHDVGVESRGVDRPGGEHRDPALERLERPQRDVRRDRIVELASDCDDEVGHQPPVGAEVGVEPVLRADDEDAPIDRDRWDRAAA